MIASLPMYDLPELRPHTDRLWQALAAALGVSLSLSRGADWAGPWSQPDLLFSQTCGYPLTHGYRGMLTPVTTPHYDADGCVGPTYCSLIMARKPLALAELRGATAAINGWDSMSGMLALKTVFAPLSGAGGFFGKVMVSGSHVGSLAALQAGDADVCAIDCVTAALLRRNRPEAFDRLHEIARSQPVPGLPYVTVAGDVVALRRALDLVMGDTALAETRAALLLAGHTPLPLSAYDVILAREAALAGRDPLAGAAGLAQ